MIQYELRMITLISAIIFIYTATAGSGIPAHQLTFEVTGKSAGNSEHSSKATPPNNTKPYHNFKSPENIYAPKGSSLVNPQEMRQHISRTISQVKLAVDAIQNSRAKDGITTGLAVALAQIGEVTSGLNMARSIRRRSIRTDALVAIAEIHVRAGDLQGALKIVVQSHDENARVQILDSITKHHIKSGDTESALGTLIIMPDSMDKDFLFSEIAKERAAMNDSDGMFKIINKVKDETLRETVFTDLALLRAEEGDIEGALRFAALTSSERAANRSRETVAQKRIQQGDFRGARAIAVQISNLESRADTLKELV
jgi:hypothetical protein